MGDTFDTGFAGALRPTDPDRAAVIAVDLMRAYFDPGSPLCLPSAQVLAGAARVLQAARQRKIPVIHTRVAYAEDGSDGGMFIRKVPALGQLCGGGPLSEIMPEMAPMAGELVITKQYASAFFGTSLASTLVARRVETVIIVGVSTSGCIRATGVDAMQHGFIPLVVRDAVGDRTEQVHAANLFDLQAKYAEVVDAAQVVAFLQGAAS